MIQDAFDLISALLLQEDLLFIISPAHSADILSLYEMDMVIFLALASSLFTHETGMLQQKQLF